MNWFTFGYVLPTDQSGRLGPRLKSAYPRALELDSAFRHRMYKAETIGWSRFDVPLRYLVGPSRFRIALVGLVSGLVFATGSLADEARQRFDLISVGMTRAAVLALMPPPSTSIETSTLGVSHGQLRWLSSPGALTINFVGDRVYGKSACDRATDC